MFFVEPVLNSREHRQKLIETLFENFQFNGIYMHKAQVLSTYLFAKESAMIVDVGAEYTHIVPVI
jgi:actin-related protein